MAERRGRSKIPQASKDGLARKESGNSRIPLSPAKPYQAQPCNRVHQIRIKFKTGFGNISFPNPVGVCNKHEPVYHAEDVERERKVWKNAITNHVKDATKAYQEMYAAENRAKAAKKEVAMLKKCLPNESYAKLAKRAEAAEKKLAILTDRPELVHLDRAMNGTYSWKNRAEKAEKKLADCQRAFTNYRYRMTTYKTSELAKAEAALASCQLAADKSAARVKELETEIARLKKS